MDLIGVGLVISQAVVVVKGGAQIIRYSYMRAWRLRFHQENSAQIPR
jgi:hypothetical protein